MQRLLTCHCRTVKFHNRSRCLPPPLHHRYSLYCDSSNAAGSRTGSADRDSAAALAVPAPLPARRDPRMAYGPRWRCKQSWRQATHLRPHQQLCECRAPADSFPIPKETSYSFFLNPRWSKVSDILSKIFRLCSNDCAMWANALMCLN